MKRVCAWCNTHLAPEDPGSPSEFAVSHGICQACAAFLVTRRVALRDLLEKLDGAIMVVDEDGAVKLANSRVLQLLQKRAAQVEGKLGGDVIECIYATEPGGCGKTIHCNGCTIRNNVTATLETGKSVTNTSAYSLHKDGDGDGVTRADWHISTERVGDVVLLQIAPA